MRFALRTTTAGATWVMALLVTAAGASGGDVAPGVAANEAVAAESEAAAATEVIVPTPAQWRAITPPSDPRTLYRMQLCGPFLAPAPDAVDRNLRTAPETPVELFAQQIDSDPLRARYYLRGDAELLRLDQRLRADEIELDEATGSALVPDAFSYSEAGLHFEGESGRFDLQADAMQIDTARFRIHPYHHGAARRLSSTRRDGTELTDLRYTTCPPGREQWWLQAAKLRFDFDEGLGYAHHARIEIGGVPLFYTPYLQFPIDDRPRSGLLPPSFGHSATHGGYLTLPVYVRLAPNYDLTLSPTYYSRRGLQLGSGFRYLRRSFSGELYFDYLPDDDVYAEEPAVLEEENAQTERWALDWQHRGTLAGGINYRVDIDRVSDPLYPTDFSTDLVGSSASELESRAVASQSLGNHRWEAELQHWQNLRPPEERDDPYRRWPAIDYQHTPGRLAGHFDYRLEAQAVDFELPRGPTAARPTGRRYHANPRLSLPIHRPAFFVEPSLSLHYSEYDLTAVEEEGSNGPLTRTVPVTQLDAGIFLERPLRIGSGLFLQTLEPRLLYLYVPPRNQDDIPIFDTTARGNTVAELFAENRYTGIDRIGDTEQITTALTTRVLNIVDGNEPLRASVGQIYYLRDREVTLPEERLEEDALTRHRSDLFFDADARLPGNLNLRAEYRYNPRREEPVASAYSAQWQYRPASRALINLGYRVTEAITGRDEDDKAIFERTQDLVEASAVVPIGLHWYAVGGWQYSRLEQSHLEVVTGVEYRECCWAARGVVRRFRRGDELEMENTLMFEFELTGLSRLGQDTRSFLEDVVPGYGAAVF